MKLQRNALFRFVRALAGTLLGALVAVLALRWLHDAWWYGALEQVHHTDYEDLVYFSGMIAWSLGGSALGGLVCGVLSSERGAARGAIVSAVVCAVFFLIAVGRGNALDSHAWLADFERPWHHNQTLWVTLGLFGGGAIGGLAGVAIARKLSAFGREHGRRG